MIELDWINFVWGFVAGAAAATIIFSILIWYLSRDIELDKDEDKT